MTDPITLLREANPVRDCSAPDFERVLERVRAAPPHGPEGRRRARVTVTVAWLLPVVAAAAVALFVVISLRPAGAGLRTPGPRPGGPATATVGQARGHVLAGSMDVFSGAASGEDGQTWGAEWFRTSAGQVCVQAGRMRSATADGPLGTFDRAGRFRAFPPNTAVDARCAATPTRGGVALLAVARYADSGAALTAGGACASARSGRCRTDQTTTLYFGLLGASAGAAGYGSPLHPVGQTLSPSPSSDGEYLQTAAGGAGSDCATATGSPCPTQPSPIDLVHPGSTAFVIYPGGDHPCVLHGPGVDGVMSGDCPYGFSSTISAARLTAASVRTPVRITVRAPTRSSGHSVVPVIAHLRTRVSSSRIGGYSVDVSSPARGCGPDGGAGSGSFGFGQTFSAGEQITLQGEGTPVCTGTYTGSVVVRPLVGPELTVAHFHFHLTAEHAR